jgi:hypothetical protein
MRLLAALAALVIALSARGTVTFVAPQAGAPALGPQIIEITTDAEGVDRVEFRVDGVLAGVARTAPYRLAYDFGNEKLEGRTITATVFWRGYSRRESAEIITAALTAGESISVDLVEVPLRVRSRRAVRAEDIRLLENGVAQTIREVLPVRPPAHFAFVVDRSSSMGGGRLEATLRAIDAVRGQLRPGDSASLVLFNHHVARPLRLDGSSTAAASLRNTIPSGGTSLRDAVVSTRSSTAARTYVIVITDGADRNSALSAEEAQRRMSSTKTVVSAITFGDDSPFLDRITKATGGSMATATSASVAQRLSAIVEDINSRYTVIYQSSGNGPGWRTITVSPKARGLSLAAARTRYFAE